MYSKLVGKVAKYHATYKITIISFKLLISRHEDVSQNKT